MLCVSSGITKLQIIKLPTNKLVTLLILLEIYRNAGPHYKSLYKGYHVVCTIL